MTDQEAQLWQAYGAMLARQYDTERELRALKSRVAYQEQPDGLGPLWWGMLAGVLIMWLVARVVKDADAEVIEHKPRRRIEPVS